MAQHAQLNNIDHADLKVRVERSAALGDAVMSCRVFPHEFRSLQPHYPVVFAKDVASGRFSPIALFGLEKGENLFLTDGGGWDAAYVPLAMRMAPFLIGFTSAVSGARQADVHIDLDHPRVTAPGGEPVFLDHGGRAEVLTRAGAVLDEVRAGDATVEPFCALLSELDLLEPFSLDVTLENGAKGRLAGLYVIAEETLYGLDGDALARLQAAHALQPVFMAVASLSQLRALVERRNARLRAAAEAVS